MKQNQWLKVNSSIPTGFCQNSLSDQLTDRISMSRDCSKSHFLAQPLNP